MHQDSADSAYTITGHSVSAKMFLECGCKPESCNGQTEIYQTEISGLRISGIDYAAFASRTGSNGELGALGINPATDTAGHTFAGYANVSTGTCMLSLHD